jgi:SNF2 family DNA or RNA helicase
VILRPYQALMRAHAHEHARCGLWAQMGLGKTLTSLTLLDDLQLLSPEPALILAPLRVAATTWPDEAKKWGFPEVTPIIGSAKERERALRRDSWLYTMNYENLPWLEEHLDGRWPFTKVIADESTRLKNFRGGIRVRKDTGKAYFQKGGGVRSSALAKASFKTQWWINLAGTPAPNGLIDLWGQNWFLDRGERLGRTFGAFQDRWFHTIEHGEDHRRKLVPKRYALDEIGKAVSDLCISVRTKDWFDIAEPIVRQVVVQLPPKARELYSDMEDEMFARIGSKDVEAFNKADATMKCLQMASGAVYTDKKGAWVEFHDAKLEALESIVNEAAGMPILVATWWKHDVPRIQKAFKSARVLDKNSQTIRDWNAGKIPMLLAHPASAGHGLNLQDGGNIIAFFSHWWDMELRDQILERIGPARQMQSGYDRPVFVYNIVADDTADLDVIASHEAKRTMQDAIMHITGRSRR